MLTEEFKDWTAKIIREDGATLPNAILSEICNAILIASELDEMPQFEKLIEQESGEKLNYDEEQNV